MKLIKLVNQLNTDKIELHEDLESIRPHYSNLSDSEFMYYINLDPTYTKGSTQQGSYARWILDLTKREQPIEGENQITQLLDAFDRAKRERRLRDNNILNCRSVKDLAAVVAQAENVIPELSHRQEVRQRQSARKNADLNTDAELVYEDNDWEVWVPKTYAASCKLGQGAKWCTASTEQDYNYNYYTSKGPLYININKQDPQEKYQFHFEEEQFMDKENNPIDLSDFFPSAPKLYNFYNSLDVEKPYNWPAKQDVDAFANAEVIIKNNIVIQANKFLKEINIPKGVIKIGKYAFGDCTRLTSVTIPNSVTEIGEDAFSGCTSLTSVTIPNSVTEIGWGAFTNCRSLTSIKIPNSVTKIGNYAFFYCYNLTSIIIPDSVIEIGNSVFYGCRSLTSVTIPNSVTKIGESAFYDCPDLTVMTDNAYVIHYCRNNGINYKYVTDENLKDNAIAEKATTPKQRVPYVYEGPVTTFGHLFISHGKWYTSAVSEKQALNQIANQIRVAEKKTRDFKLELDSKYLAEVPDIEQKQLGYCATCGELLTDSGECPFCDLHINEDIKNDILIKQETSDEYTKFKNSIKSPEELLTWMSTNISYDLPDEEYDDESDIYTKTSEQVYETKKGHCAEQSYLEKDILENLGYNCDLYFCKENNSNVDYGSNGNAHVFVVYKDNDKYKYFENSMERARGIHKFNSLDDCFDYIAQMWRRCDYSKYEEDKDLPLATTIEFRKLDKPVVGINNADLSKECYKFPIIAERDISNNKLEEKYISKNIPASNLNLIEKIVRVGNKWQVQSEKGRNMGTYDTKAEAEDRLQQVHYFKHMNEDEDIEEAVEIHDILNPKLWNDHNELLPEVRAKVEKIVKLFTDQLKKDGVDLKVEDVYILGSNANYNYNEESDLDIHIIADETADCIQKHLPVIYNAYKTLFNKKYDISIRGINVEIYVENKDALSNIPAGIYSLRDGWIKDPANYNFPETDQLAIDKQVQIWENRYYKIINEKDNVPELTLDDINDYINDIYKMRKESLDTEGEFGIGNLVFKEVRRLGYLDDLKLLRDKLVGQTLSIEL